MIIIGFSLSRTIPASASSFLMRFMRRSFISASYLSLLKIIFAVSSMFVFNWFAAFTIGTTIFFITFFLLSSLPSSLIPSNPFLCFLGSSSFPYKASPIPFWIFSRTGLRTAAAAATGLTFGSVGVGAAAPPFNSSAPHASVGALPLSNPSSLFLKSSSLSFGGAFFFLSFAFFSPLFRASIQLALP